MFGCEEAVRIFILALPSLRIMEWDITTFEYLADLLGTMVFAISGVLVVTDRGFDWMGAVFTGFVTAIGGGTLRDVLLGIKPLAWVSDPMYLYVILGGFIVCLFFYDFLIRLSKTLLLFDTLGIAFFTVLGTEKALNAGVSAEIAVIMGMFSAVMGGVIRDTLINRTPVIFRREIYATPCLVGGSLFALLTHFEVSEYLSTVISILSIVVFRLLAIKFNIVLPSFSKDN
jgi:uncharacterized membrane protein YeiH